MLAPPTIRIAALYPPLPPAPLPGPPPPPPLPVQARENAGSALFLELLFWKGANVADDVRNEYNWRVGAVTLGECVCEFWGGLGRW